jgi:transcriptional regulator with XRE-family HTH domain
VSDGSPVVQRRRLRTELRKTRQDAGVTQEEVAAAMDWSLSKVIRIEVGSVGISTNDLKALLHYYKIVDPRRTQELVALARAARERSWWSMYRDVASPRLLQLIGYESAASILRNFEPLIVPDLLQTEEYARAVIRGLDDRSPSDLVDTQAEIRMRRQKLVDRTDPPLLFFVLDEAVVHRLVGGTGVMRRQVRRLIDMADRPHVTIEIVPFSAGVHPGLNGPFVVLEFPDAGDDDVLYLENHGDAQIGRDIREEIVTYRKAYDYLRRVSLGPEDSISYLGKMADEIT